MRGLIYDMDGVIALTEDAHKKAFDATFRHLGIKSSALDWDNKFIGKGHLYILTNVFTDFKVRQSAYEWSGRWALNFRELVKKEGIKIVPGFMEFNRRSSGKKIVATGGLRANAECILNSLGLDLDIVSLENIQNPKPDPEIFLIAAERMGLKPECCTVFEDSIFGIQAGRRAGMTVVALATTHSKNELAAENPDLIISDFNDMPREDLSMDNWQRYLRK